jgi:hypothetical protein
LQSDLPEAQRNASSSSGGDGEADSSLNPAVFAFLSRLGSLGSGRTTSGELGGCPDQFRCKIMHTLMDDPVVVATGHTYERSAIEQWFKTHSTDPMTSECLVH